MSQALFDRAAEGRYGAEGRSHARRSRSPIPGRRYIDWDLVDPAGLPIDDVRAVRDEIGRRVRALLVELDET
jgi:hypothetical protein